MKNKKRAERRHRAAKIKNNLKKDNYQCQNWLESNPEKEKYILGRLLNTRVLCSKLCCRNLRRDEGPTIAERRKHQRYSD